jgi:hypothetical protein
MKKKKYCPVDGFECPYQEDKDCDECIKEDYENAILWLKEFQ